MSTTETENGGGASRPIMALLALLERRWALRVLWELRERRLSSRALRRACGDLSPTVLQARVNELRDAGLVDLAPGGGYGLTSTGLELLAAFEPLYRFSLTWGAKTTV
jgi:DNA-binding HxlR family transcriptional regulator